MSIHNVWMFHNRKLSSQVNKLHEKVLLKIYQDCESLFAELLVKDYLTTINNINLLAIELYLHE